jgi:hypothetical protein
MAQLEAKQSGWSRQRLALMVGLGVVLIGLGVLGAMKHQAANKGGDRKLCGANMEAIGRACLNYAANHQGSFPPSLTMLTEGGAGAPLQSAQLACPNANKKGHHGEFVYVPGRKKTDDPNAVLAYEPLGNHKKKPGGHVLLVNGTVRWLDEADHNTMTAQVRAFLTPSTGTH